MLMDLAQFRQACGQGTDEELVEAVRTIDPSVQHSDQAKAWIWTLAKRLLDTDRYASAGLLFWGDALFNGGPKAVQQLLRFVRTTQNMIVLGAAAMGKTYTLICYCLLDWLRDPEYTEIKVISTTGGHAKSQSFSTLQRLYKASIIPLPGISMDGFVGLNPKDRHSAISLVAIPQGEDGRGVLQGFHPVPRHSPHPVFGAMSRVRALLDEAEEIPSGVWEGVSNLLASAWGSEAVKVACATNPRDVTSKLAQLAEPVNGWTTVNLDTDKQWLSSERWHVMRLDGIDCENVQERKLVFPGFLTFEGYQKFALELGGQSPKYLTFGRGMYPLAALQNTLIPYSLLEAVIGSFIFDGRTVGCGGIDLAFEGGDRVVLFTGRYGRAIGFHPLNGKPLLWAKSRYTIQADQFYEVPKDRTIALASDLERRCKGLNVHPDWTTCDRTGVGTGTHDALCEQWSGSVRGIMWGAESGQRKLLADDHDYACEIYDGIDTEMYARLRKFLEFGFIAFAPQIQTGQLFKELSGRRYQPSPKGPSGKPRMRLEPKKEFKRRLGWSPDIADALVMMIHGAAINGPEKATMLGSERKGPRFRPGENIGLREKTAYIDWSQDV
jgi:hypothetical protein